MDLKTIKLGFRTLPKLEKRHWNVISIDNLIDDTYSITNINCYQNLAKFDFEILSDIYSHKATSHEEIIDLIHELKKDFESDDCYLIATNPIYKSVEGCICPIERYFQDNAVSTYPDLLKLRHAIACASIQSSSDGKSIDDYREDFFKCRSFEQLKGYSRNLLATWLFFINE